MTANAREPVDAVLSGLKWAALLAFLGLAAVNGLSWRVAVPSSGLLFAAMVVVTMVLFAPAVFFGHRLSGDGSPASFADLTRNAPWWTSALIVLLFGYAFACLWTGGGENARLLRFGSAVCMVFAIVSFAVYRAAQRLPAEPAQPPRARKWWDRPMMRIGFWD
jgi:hypothetical protein